METKTNQFWREYRKSALLGWVFLVATPILPIILGTILHFVLGESKLVSFIPNALALVLFFLFIYHSWKFILARCPHCGQLAVKFKNRLFPFDPVCPKCGKRMDTENED